MTDMPEEIYAHEMSPNKNGRHGGWIHPEYFGGYSGAVAYVRKDLSKPKEVSGLVEALEHISSAMDSQVFTEHTRYLLARDIADKALQAHRAATGEKNDKG